VNTSRLSIARLPGSEPRSPESRSDGDRERLAAAERYAAGLARQNGVPYHVDVTMRGWLRVFQGTTESRSVVCFVGSTSGGVYSAKTVTKYGHRIGNVFAFAAQFDT
jgi:hypothetical protein